MLASLQNVLPSSVLSSISNNPATKNQPQQGADDVGNRDNYPSSSSNNRVMSVDEQGVKKRKGKSNEVSHSFCVFVLADADAHSASTLTPPPPLVCLPSSAQAIG